MILTFPRALFFGLTLVAFSIAFTGNSKPVNAHDGMNWIIQNKAVIDQAIHRAAANELHLEDHHGEFDELQRQINILKGVVESLNLEVSSLMRHTH